MKSWYRPFLEILLASAIMLTSSLAFSLEKIPLIVYLFIGVTISLVVATILSIRNKNAEGLGVKLIYGGVYFWVVAFIQLMILAAITHFNS